ncbi:cation-translocating P-type ATPase [Desulfatitalea alkaliphila]|uniref:Cation-transporting P-type ATPase n=1 Tax=Desulfatitalea alkaliphila TaxID=2929485 RepID=A0AA41UJ56_9BACT|nr:cation-transporting P-type ATPase [Desulfatitalea alkaliphila]MCJ8499021.1 cation-transporting P-type ATPase [Desulfatitalea alkaliphila]
MVKETQTIGKQNNRGAVPWHAMTDDEVLSSLGVDDGGLTEDEAARRTEKYGPNKLAEKKQAGPLKRLFRQFQNVLIYVLLAAAVFTALLGQWVDTAVIVAVVIINAIIGFVQEGKAEKAMEAIRGMLSPKATALREGGQRELPAEELVPGDIVLLGSGDRVPADMRIIFSRNAQADEAMLTGESEPVDKRVDPVDEDAPICDRENMAFSGTVLTSGRLRGVVTATGEHAEIGRISEMVSKVEDITTPLVRKMDRFGRGLSVFIVLLSAVIFVIGYFLRGFGFTEMVMAVVSLAVAAIPQGLPAIMTVTLALGVQRMARRNAIIRRLPAVETLGSVTVICTDKTGTLTRNEMTVVKIAVADRMYSVSGIGYTPEGQITVEGDEKSKISLEEHPWITELARTGLLASEARLREDNGSWTIDGMPTEGSIVVLARKAGMTRTDEQEKRPRLDLLPFESDRRYMATLNKDPDAGPILCVKGAPERVLDMCTRQRSKQGDTPIDRNAWIERQEKLAGTGHRVLALATRPMNGTESIQEQDITDLTLLGLVGIIDPPREEAVDAIKTCRKAGIRVKMVTGDHALTARSIGDSMGIGDGEHVLTGKDLEQMDQEEMVRQVNQHDIFARSSPEHKLRMIEALQSKEQIVAMTGDGVNDAPALKRADVGVSMGIKGSEAAKEASEMVLADDNFATIERAVEEGRTIYDNLVKVILFVLPTNGAEALMIISAVIVLFEVMPITPLQILWVNMVTAVTLAVSLAFEPPQAWIMRRPPRPPGEPIISPYLFWRIIFVAVLIATSSILLFNYMRAAGASLEAARTVAVNTLVAGQMFYLFNSRFIEQSSLNLQRLLANKKALVSVVVLAALQFAFTYLAPMQQLFGTASISIFEWGWCIAAGAGVFLIVETEKAIKRGMRT